MTVGQRIRQKRIELGLTQIELAERMGYSGKTSVSAAETCGDNITTTKVQKFADALGVSFHYLMGYDESNAVSEPGTAMVLSSEPYISNEDQQLLDDYHNVSPETRAAIDLLLKAGKQKP